MGMALFRSRARASLGEKAFNNTQPPGLNAVCINCGFTNDTGLCEPVVSWCFEESMPGYPISRGTMKKEKKTMKAVHHPRKYLQTVGTKKYMYR